MFQRTDKEVRAEKRKRVWKCVVSYGIPTAVSKQD